ncbi:AAA family ATPase [Candidatus Microgenomates bacterium]|nr:AAA family ATPase [Candidatus Microgenomates bacterium]
MEELQDLNNKISSANLPQPLLEKVTGMVSRLERISKIGGNYLTEFDNASRYIDWVINLPWGKRSTDILDFSHADEILNKNHYGLRSAKERILEYLAVLKLNSNSGSNTVARAPIMALIGLVGTGKTTLAYSIAEAMGRKFERVPFGGIGDTQYLRGQSRAFLDAEPGAIIKAIRRAGTKNPVILLDEIDRVDEAVRASIMGVLVELLDPGQNSAYTDHYIDYPFDLSEVLFVVTANNSTNISTAVLDRLELISMPSYSDEEKITIARDFILPKALASASMTPDNLKVEPDIWPKVIRPLGFDGGIRTLERAVNNMVRKTAMQIVTGQTRQVIVNEQNLNDYLPQ